MFFDLNYSQEESLETSKTNRDEANFLLTLFKTLLTYLDKSEYLP